MSTAPPAPPSPGAHGYPKGFTPEIAAERAEYISTLYSALVDWGFLGAYARELVIAELQGGG